MKLTIVAGARPNFMKIAPIIHEIEKTNKEKTIFEYRLVHTGQHYDKNMSKSFFDELQIPVPHINLNCSGGTQTQMTANIMVKFEKELINNPSCLVIVVGDVNSTMACAIVAQKLKINVAHVEGGIRSGDWDMPEEINRLITDSITNYFYTTSETANQNLLNNGVPKNNIVFVGNTMIDSLLNNIDKVKQPEVFKKLNITKKKYFVVTLHRPSNVDDSEILLNLLNYILKGTNKFDVIFPMHPRTKIKFDDLNFSKSKLHIVPPMSYLEFIFSIKNCLGVITDSGGITEEATLLNIPCITLRNTTERPETVKFGTNELIGDDFPRIVSSIEKIINNKWKKGSIPKYWDGKSAKRIVKHLKILKDNYEER